MSTDSPNGLPACSGALMSLSIIAVALRMYARKQQKARFMADDWTVLVALIAYIGAAITTFVARDRRVLGFSTADTTAAMAEASAKVQIALDVCSTTSLALVKISALFFYRRVFCAGEASPWFNTVLIVTTVVIVLWLITFQFLTGFQCGTHFPALWDGGYLEYCTISFPFLYGVAVSDFLLDVWILALPIPLILRWHISPAKRLSIFGVFLLAFLGLAASIARMVVIIMDELGGPTYLVTHDEEHIVTTYFFFVMLENGMSLIAVNLPSLWFFCTSVIPEQVVRSVRSMVSLFSLNSSGRSRPAENSGGERLDSTDHAKTEKPGSAPARVTDDSLPLPLRSDLERQEYAASAKYEPAEETSLPKDKIKVQHTIEVGHE